MFHILPYTKRLTLDLKMGDCSTNHSALGSYAHGESCPWNIKAADMSMDKPASGPCAAILIQRSVAMYLISSGCSSYRVSRENSVRSYLGTLGYCVLVSNKVSAGSRRD